MKCPHCHAEHQDGLFCAKCGKPLDESVSDMTRVMPPLEDMRAPEDAAAPKEGGEEAPADDAVEAAEAPSTEEAPEAASDAAEEGDEAAAASEDASDATEASDSDTTEDTASPVDAADEAVSGDTVDDDDIDISSIEGPAEPTPEEAAKTAKRKKIMTIAALVCGIAIAALSGMYLFSNYFDGTEPIDPSTKVKNADTIAPDTSLAEDTIVGHWRHYNTGSVIEKIGTGRYRWTIEDDAYQLDFKENKYIYEDENGNVYTFVLINADRLQLAESKDADGGLISSPVFESGYIAGRVGQDGTMTKNLSVNAEAFNIVGRTYADLAGTYGPGALSVVGDDQYIIFRADGGNFAVQFTGETVPLKKKSGEGYKVVKLTNTTPTNPNPGTELPNTGDPNSGTTPAPNTGTTEPQEDKEYKVEIPDMPTFPSNSAVATGVVWADLGFVIKNAPDTMTVNDLSAVLGIALEVGAAPANASGFNFYGSSEGYFAGTYGINDHSFYVSGYGKNALSPDKTILFIQQIS